ncbi:ribokinase [Sphingomonas arantia]|uniref:Ribokinase n=1 Tax=Sphingomonas arantia TaxID=1460676 RepID=A0ABW4U2Q1_9SPHN
MTISSKAVPRIVVIGSVNTDIILRVAALPRPNETILGRGSETVVGGKGLNQAVAAARLGAETHMVAAIGDDAHGDAARAHLIARGVDVAHVTTTAGTATGTAHILVADDASNSIVVTPGANAALTPAMVEAATALIAGADAVVVQLEVPLPTVQAALEIARRHTVRTILNPAPSDRAALALFPLADLVTPNETELADLTGIDGSNDAAIHAALNDLRQRGARDGLVTLGPRGSAALIGGMLVFQPALRIAAVDTTGAGDVFNAALACELARGFPLLRAMEFASAAAALSVSRASADSAPTRSEVETLLARRGDPA